MSPRTVMTQDDRIEFPSGMRFGEGSRYEIRERIGRGGMADVYKVVDTNLNNRLYAVKILSSATGSHPSGEMLRALFIEEAAALSRIRDNNVVAVITNGRLSDQNQTPYMVMEYLDGRDLSALLKAEKQLPIERAVDIILAVCAGINACHLAGVIHRDLKPANIFLDQTLKGEEPKVLDFSVAKIPVSRDQTKTDFVVGTEQYMAPEQANGKPADERSDQYSIGALLYRCLTGQIPRGFPSKPREERPEIPEDLEAALLRAMDRKPERRFETVHEFGRYLLPSASANGRAKWDHYYTTPPVPVRAAFTGPLPSPAAPITSAVVVTRVNAYDFLAHERTTHLVDDHPSATTIPDRLPEISVQKTTAAAEGSAVVPSSAVGPYRGRRLLIIAAVLVCAVFGLALTAVLRSSAKHEVAPAPPSWTRSVEPAVPPPTEPAAVSPHLEPRLPPRPAQDPPDPAPAAPVVDMARADTVQPIADPSPRPKKRRLRAPTDHVRYTPQRIPIVR